MLGLLQLILRFTIEVGFGLFSTLILLRFFLQCVKANFYHPLIQALVKVTNPVLMPIRRITPTFSRYDWSCFVLLLLMGMIKYALFIALSIITSYKPLIVLGFILLDIASGILYLYLFLFIIQAITSWLGSSPQMGLVLALLHQLTAPVLKRVRPRVVYANIDFRPMIAMFLIFLGLSILSYFRYQLI